MALYRTFADPWKTEYNSVDNFILAQYSKQELVNIISKSGNQYDYVLFVRPDCLYLDKFDIGFFNHIDNQTICIPNFHLYGPDKFNDRFCIANMKTYKIYGNVYKYLLEISKKMPLHSETVLGWWMRQNMVKTVRIKFNFSRVRFNGKIVDKF